MQAVQRVVDLPELAEGVESRMRWGQTLCDECCSVVVVATLDVTEDPAVGHGGPPEVVGDSDEAETRASAAGS